MAGPADRAAPFRSLTTRERAALLAGAAPSPDLGARRHRALAARPLPPVEVLRGLGHETLVAALGLGPAALRGRSTGFATAEPPAPLARRLDDGPARLLRAVAPLVAPSVAAVAARLGDGPVLDGALAALVKRVADLALPVLVAEAQLERRRRPPTGGTPRERLADLAGRLAGAPLVDAYPVLARRLSRAAAQWHEAVAELCDRAVEDKAVLAGRFGASGPVTGLRLDLGDRHRGGRAVAEVAFASGQVVVYKPRPLAVETRLQAFLAEVAAATGLELASRTMVDRGAYGWDTLVDQHVPVEPAEVPRYFHRVGVLLGVLAPLRVRDLHGTNLVASGAWPVLLDGEAVLVPALRRGGPPPGVDLSGTVLATGALPGWGTVPDVSALGARPGATVATGGPVLVHADSDEIAIEPRHTVTADPRSLPMAAGGRVGASGFVAEVLSGFDAGRGLAPRWWQRFAADAAGDDVRVVVRPTRFYAELQLAATDPRVLGDALELDALFDHLAVSDAVPLHAQLLASERAQLHDLDVPVFTARPSGTVLVGGDGAELQGLVVGGGGPDGPEASPARDRHLVQAVLTAGPARARTFPGLPDAAAIGRLLAELALPGAAGATWVRPVAGDDGVVRLEPLGLDLYDGLPGVVLFLAELGDTALARRGAAEITALLDGAELNTGAWGGAAGVAYVLARLADLWDDRALRATAHRLLAAATDRLGDGDACCTVSGAAGLALVARRLAHDEVARRARRHLVERAVVDTATGEPSWPAADHGGRTVGGLAHGLAGIAWALGASHPLAAAARAAERRRFEAAAAAAADHHPDGAPEATNSWCHGPPGLAVAGGEGVADAVARALAAPAPETDGLCHGRLGVYESVAIAARREGRPDWAAAAAERARAVAARAARSGWRLASTSDTPPLGLLTGIAGVGHALLRLHDPAVPAVLALD